MPEFGVKADAAFLSYALCPQSTRVVCVCTDYHVVINNSLRSVVKHRKLTNGNTRMCTLTSISPISSAQVAITFYQSAECRVY
jgi:hypothetical protein